MTLGIFDSGLGGLTVLREVRRRLPSVDLVYVADQANVPYGDRTEAELRVLLARNLARLERLGVDAIVIGCNTTCAIAHTFGWPPAHVPVLDLIDAAAAAVTQSGARRIGVIATAATARSGAYGVAIRAHVPGALVMEVGAPELVPLVEVGALEGDLPRQAVARACAGLRGEIDALVFACSHYPLLEPHFRAELGPTVTLIDPALAQAQRAAEFAAERDLGGSGRTRFLTTGARAPFARALAAILGPLHEVEQAEEDADRGDTEHGPRDDLQQGVGL